MGIFDALTTAVAGLQAQSFALQNISGNIANSQTTGYKETDTSFQDLVSAAAAGQQTAGGVIASSVATNTVQGRSRARGLDRHGHQRRRLLRGRAADGIYRQSAELHRRQDYTRAGDFQMNANGNLVNSAGYYLHGHPGQPDHRESRRQRPAGLAIQQQFRAGAGDDADSISGQPSEHASPAMLDPSDFDANPIAARRANHRFRGDPPAGRSRRPAPARWAGSRRHAPVAGITAATRITVSDGTNTTSLHVAGATSRVADLINAINAGPRAMWIAALSAAADLVLTGNNRHRIDHSRRHRPLPISASAHAQPCSSRPIC